MSLPAGNGTPRLRPPTDGDLTIERLEDRTLLAGITISGTVMLATGGAGTPVRNAMVWVAIPVTYTDASNHAYETVLLSLPNQTFTDGSGAFTVELDDAPPTGCTAVPTRPNGAITVYVTAKAPTLTPGMDPNDLKPAYSVIDGLLNPYEEDYVGQPTSRREPESGQCERQIGPKGGSSFTVIDSNSYADTYNAMTAFTVLATYWGYATQDLQIPWGSCAGAILVNPLEVLYPVSGGDRSGFIPGIPLLNPPGMTDPEILLSQTEFAAGRQGRRGGIRRVPCLRGRMVQAQRVRDPQFSGKRPAPHR